MKNFFQQTIRIGFVLALAVILLLPGSAASAVAYDGNVTQIVIKYWSNHVPADPAGTEQMARLSAAAGVTLTYVRAAQGNTHILALPASTPMDTVLLICNNLEQDLMDAEDQKELMYAVPYVTPNDPLYPPNTESQWGQWNLFGDTGINAPMAWGIETGREDVIVAVLDSGRVDHDDLVNVLDGYDFASEPATLSAYDPGGYDSCPERAWQGTHVAGIIGATSNNTSGIAGIDWHAAFLPVRVTGTCGPTDAIDIVDGMKWAAGLVVPGTPQRVAGGDWEDDPAKIIHVSASIPGQTCTTYQSAINDIIASGAIIIAAAGDTGNTGTDVTISNSFPANCDGVITVAATDRLGNRADYSNYGTAVEISAPGGGNGQGDIMSTSITGVTVLGDPTYKDMHGTAMAAAHVSGVVSLMASINPNITPSLVLEILQTTATPFGESTCTTATCGSGIVNAGEALRATKPDLVITKVDITSDREGLNPKLTTDAKGNPKLEVAEDETVYAQVLVKNRGGKLTPSIVTVQVYVDRDPTTTVERDNRGCLLDPEGKDLYPSGEEDWGEFRLSSGSTQLDPGTAATLTIPIVWRDIANPVTWGDGTHQLYVYADANCLNSEGFEDNNSFEYVEINPYVRGLLLYPDEGEQIGTNYNPTFKWNKVDRATKYQIYVTKLPDTKVFDQTYDASTVCDTATPTCSVTPGPKLPLKPGNYSWKMRAYAGTEVIYPWTVDPVEFVVGVPGKPVLKSPIIDDIDTYMPVYTWEKVDGAATYTIQVTMGAKLVFRKTYKATAICTETECKATGKLLKPGSFEWQVQASNPYGKGEPGKATFSTLKTPPVKVTLTDPVGSVDAPEDIDNYMPTYTWNRVPGATSYLLQVKMGDKVVFKKPYKVESICNATLCKVKSALLKVGTYQWQVQASSPAGIGEWSDAAYFKTPGNLLPPALISPVGSVGEPAGTTFAPEYKWGKVDGATSYLIQVSTAGTVVFKKSYTASVACKETLECTVKSPLLKSGLYTWQVQAFSPAGFSSSEIAYFSTPAIVDMGKAEIITPKGIDEPIQTYTPVYAWYKVDEATSYVVRVKNGTTVVFTKTYKPTICVIDNGAVCSVTGSLLKPGDYSWEVQTFIAPAGSSTSDSALFRTRQEPPPNVTLTFPIGNIGAESSPKYTWNRGENAWATQFLLVVKRPDGKILLNKSYAAASICKEAVCTVGKTAALKLAGNYTWQVQPVSPAGTGEISEATFTVSKPAKPVLAYPFKADGGTENMGTIYNPPYTWYRVDTASRYYVIVKTFIGTGTKTTTVLKKWFTLASLNCGEETCSLPVSLSPTLKGGIHTWQVQAGSSVGVGELSDPAKFQTDTQVSPGVVWGLAINPVPNNNPKAKPIYTWRNAGPMATSYALYVKGISGFVALNKSYRAVDICDETTCSITSPTILPGEKYTWWIQAYNPTVYGPWRNMTFDVSSVPAAAQNLLVTTGTPDQPTYTWDEVPNATSYHLYVTGPGDYLLNRWYPTTICADGTCSVTSPATLGAGEYTWSVLAANDSSHYGIWSTTGTFTIP